MTSELEWKIKNLPDSPGCYLMKCRGEIIYVGKAKNLKNRVRQYFHASASHTAKVRAMVEKVDDFDIVLVDGELEALMLECNLIKQHMPHYNILLKDDKQYPYIRVDLKEPYPCLELRRRQAKDGARYFGPFIGASAVREVLDTVRSVFPVRSCTKKLEVGSKLRPCLYAQTGQCLAPCAGRVTPEEYGELMNQVIRFLSGHSEEVIGILQQKMMDAAKTLNYERAALCRDRIKAINDLMQKQKTVSTGWENRDIIACLPCLEDMLVQLMRFQNGRMLLSEVYTLEGAARDEEKEVLTRFVTQLYSADNPPATEVVLPCALDESAVIEELFTNYAGRRVRLTTPQRGDKAALIRMAQKNLRDEAAKLEKKRENIERRTQGALKELQEVLGLEAPPRRIEGYDISNTQGAQSIASEVVMIDGEIAKKEYRQYKIKTVEGPNDFASMHEVITRRFEHAKKERAEREAQGLDINGGSFTDLPDLILIDGGRGQLSSAMAALDAAGLFIPMFGLAERLDEIVLPYEDDTLLLDRHSPALHLIERLRDEAHRFAITQHRKLRGKHTIASRLEEIPGIGPARRKALLTHFKTLEELKSADVNAIAETEGIGEKYAKLVYEYLHKQE